MLKLMKKLLEFIKKNIKVGKKLIVIFFLQFFFFFGNPNVWLGVLQTHPTYYYAYTYFKRPGKGKKNPSLEGGIK